MLNRRTLLKSLLAAPLVARFMRPTPVAAAVVGSDRRVHIAVVGAGVFGGWVALHLARQGLRVTLLDGWGPGNSRASSGGETRVIRHAYADAHHVALTRRALALWKQAERDWQRRLFFPTGVLFLDGGAGTAYLEAATEHLRAAGIVHELLDHDALARRFPQINPEGLHGGLLEPDSGYLLARRSCEAVVRAFVDAGGDYRQRAVRPGRIRGGRLEALKLSDGQNLAADTYVFACGPWLPQLFPEVVGPVLKVTRQEVFYFGSPAGDARFDEQAMPVWADFGPRLWYGIPGSERRGFKLADDSRGPAFDPTAGERIPTQQGIEAARTYLTRRFPGLRGAPLLEARVCQYSQTPDGDFVIDRHPEAANLWLAGGGSGHGFKHGPALGERIAGWVIEEAAADAHYRLERFQQ